MAGLALGACTTAGAPHVDAVTTIPTSQITTEAHVTPPSVTIETTKAPTPRITTHTSEAIKQREGLAGCLQFSDLKTYPNREYEVCTAYVTNSASIALQGLYKFGNNKVGYLADGARHHFETRYWGQPRADIEQRVDSWPTTTKLTGNKVKQSITLLALSSSLTDDRAILKTRESWRVTAPDGTVLLDEPLATREATMCRGRLPGHPLHEWVVVGQSADPNYDCIGFDNTNGLQP
jgi:hypothetical protein